MILINDFRPNYDSSLPLSGYILSSAGRLASSASTIQKEVERLGGTFSTKIDPSVGIIISSQGFKQRFHFSFSKIILRFCFEKMKFKK